VTDGTWTTTRAYDALGRVAAKDVPGFGVTVFGYDIDMGGGQWAETATDPRGGVTRKTYDRAGRLYRVYDGGGTTTYAYCANGNVESMSYPGGTVEEYEYYADNKLWKLTNRRGGVILDAYQYAYDAAGNMTYKAELRGTTAYTYDGQNRLLTVTEPGGKETGYTYDGAGNRLSETVTENSRSTVTRCVYDERNRLTSTEKESDAGTLVTTYYYDGNGNMISKMPELYRDPSNAPESLSLVWEDGELEPAIYGYDNRDQLISSHTAGGEYAYAYNGEGLRVSKTSGEKTVQFLYEYDKIILEKETDGQTVTYARNVHGIDLISRDVGGAKAYYLYNGHHDVAQLVTETGLIVASYYYDAFGVILGETGDGGNPYRYAGYFFDAETTLYYLKSRFYDAGIARFLTEDTYRGSQDDPLSLDLYTYCVNYPVICL